MKRLIGLLLVVTLLTGCNKSSSAMDQALKFRDLLLRSGSGTFDAVITADFGDILHVFKMNCQWDSSDNMKFCVLEPETIAGVSGIIYQNNGKITFDDKALLFDTMADGSISPVNAPWVVLLAMRSGYIKGAGSNPDGCIIQLNDSYKENALNVNLQINDDCIPAFAEIFYDGRRVVSINFENFTML